MNFLMPLEPSMYLKLKINWGSDGLHTTTQLFG